MNWVYDCLILFLNYNNYIVVFTVIAEGKTFAFGKSLAKVIRLYTSSLQGINRLNESTDKSMVIVQLTYWGCCDNVLSGILMTVFVRFQTPIEKS